MKTKLKRCSVCGKDTVLWKSSPPTCKDCVGRQKAKEEANIRYKPSQPPKKVYTIPKVSDKQQKINRAYSVLHRNFLEKNPFCMAKLEGCTGKATTVHHSLGRGRYNMLNVATYKALCLSCHKIVEEFPMRAKFLKLSFNRLDK